MIRILKICFLAVALSPVFLFAQQSFPQNDFIAPVDFNMALSGTFGELRGNHFHSGIDIKTWGSNGKPLKAIADGFVSRVAVSPEGFGKAIYVEHPNGFTSVFAHCQHFSTEIDAWVTKEQYRLESFQVNLFPDKDQFNVKQGQVIAYSGNSGGSMGPHLHFEIRKTNGQIPVNPLLFGFKVKDFIRPKINRFRIYPFDKYSFINESCQILQPELSGWGPGYKLESLDTIHLSGRFYFGISTYDQLNDSNNKNGVFSISLFIDSALAYTHEMVSFPFRESRYVNSLIDYASYEKDGIRFQKTFIEPNNKLSVYGEVEGNGVFSFMDDGLHHLEYVVRDVDNNTSNLNFWVQSSPPEFREVMAIQTNTESLIFNWDEDNEFVAEGIRLTIPKGTLYDSLNFSYKIEAQSEGFFAPRYVLHNPGKAIHKSCSLSLKPVSLPDKFKDQALIVMLKDDELIAAGGKLNGDYLETRIRDFGTYSIAIDSLPPKITPLNIYPGKKVSDQKTIKFTIKDDLSGIAKYTGKINNSWILMDWDPKKNSLVYFVDDRLKSGNNIFELEVEDERGNTAHYSAEIIW